MNPLRKRMRSPCVVGASIGILVAFAMIELDLVPYPLSTYVTRL